MSADERISEEMQGAFVDGQLDAEEWAALAARLETDPGLREEVCRIRATKEMLRHAYAAAPAPAARPRRGGPGWWSLVAASLAFAVAGWVGHAHWNAPPVLDAASAYAMRGDFQGARRDWGSIDAGHVLVHVSSASRASLATALDEIEDLLRESRASKRPMEVEIVANGPGLDLLRASDVETASRLQSLRREFPGLTLVACAQTMERRRAKGEPVELVPGAVVAPSALQQVVDRLRAGWVYVRA